LPESDSGFDGIKAGAPGFCFDAFSSRESVPTSLENYGARRYGFVPRFRPEMLQERVAAPVR
jgi:hypothetical protein